VIIYTIILCINRDSKCFIVTYIFIHLYESRNIFVAINSSATLYNNFPCLMLTHVKLSNARCIY